MKKRATIVEFVKFKETIFYTVEFEGEKAMGFDFITKNSKHPHMSVLMAWIKKIGSHRSAAQHFFRQERAANALPPPINITHTECSLRWYCLRINSRAVILFNGAEKTTQKAQDCPNVSQHFYHAIDLSEVIWEEIDAGNILINENDDLEVADNYQFEISQP